MNHLDTKETMIVELARILQERGEWFGEPQAQAVIYLFQELLEPDLDFRFYSNFGEPSSDEVVGHLEHARARGWLRWNFCPGQYGPSYEPTERGLKFVDPAFFSRYGERITYLLEVIQPNELRRFSNFQFCQKNAPSDVTELLEDLRQGGCRPKVSA